MDSLYTKSSSFSIPWWFWIVLVDVCLLIISIGARDGVEFPQAWRLYAAFNLGIEMNLAVWWSGIMLFTNSLLCYEFYVNKKKGFSLQWLALSVAFLILSIDEICSLHERLPLIYTASVLAPFLLFLGGYPLVTFLKDIKNHKTGVYLFFGFGLYASVLIQEVIEHHVEFPTWFLGIRVAIEEGSELLATFVILFGLLQLRASETGPGFMRIIPKLKLDKSFQIILWIGLVVHVLACLYILSGLSDVGERGNPGVFYPTIVSFILFCFMFWSAKNVSGLNKGFGTIAFVLFLLISMGCMFNLLFLIPKSQALIPDDFILSGFQFIYVGLLVSVLLALKLVSKINLFAVTVSIVLLVSVLVLSFSYTSLVQECLLLGVAAFVTVYYYSVLTMSVRSK